MKILVIDRDRLATQLISSKLEPAGHEIIEETVKNDAIELVGKDEIDAVLFDPAPLNNARPIVLGIRRSVNTYPYIILMSHSVTREDALRMGVNDVMSKPLDAGDLETKVKNAERLTALIKRMGDESEDFPSAGGVIAKSAFNQLFLSAIDRADRYGERAHVTFISIKNYEEIKEKDGPYAAEYSVSKMAQYLVRLRRQSDIIAQTGINEYALLLQRPNNEKEPLEAANRFVTSLNEYDDIVSSGSVPVEIAVELMDLPVGNLQAEHLITKEIKAVESSG